MKSMIAGLLVAWIIGYCSADTTPQPYAGNWNYTQGFGDQLCMKLQAGIQLDISYETHNGTKTATIMSTEQTVVDELRSHCRNSTTDTEQWLVLNFNEDRTLALNFTRNPAITKDDSMKRWQLYKIKFNFVYDPVTFPGSLNPLENETLSNTNTTIGGIATSIDRSFSCSRTGALDVTDRFKVSFTGMRVQAFMTGTDFSNTDHCQADQETTDLIPIIIGAALAALVIIVLIAYLIGRARANTPSYDNMK